MPYRKPFFVVDRDSVKANLHVLFIYEDNDERCKNPEYRDQHNALGIRVKKAFSLDNSGDTFYTDAELADNVRKIDFDIAVLHLRLKMLGKNMLLYISNNFGDFLCVRAPKTYQHLQLRLAQLRGLPK